MLSYLSPKRNWPSCLPLFHVWNILLLPGLFFSPPSVLSGVIIIGFIGFVHFSCSQGWLSFVDLWVSHFHHLGKVWTIIFSNVASVLHSEIPTMCVLDIWGCSVALLISYPLVSLSFSVLIFNFIVCFYIFFSISFWRFLLIYYKYINLSFCWPGTCHKLSDTIPSLF